jgi:tryptophanyl-tRNA synthetase
MVVKKEMEVNPWEVKGDVDYNRLVKEFGLSVIDDKLLERIKKHVNGEIHPLLRRKIFFAHRDLNWILNEYEKGNKFFLYTGRAPSGPIHIGHIMIWQFTKWLQDAFDVEVYFQFPDEEKFLFKKDLDFKTIDRYLQDNMLDIIALGFNPKKTHFIVDSVHANLMYRPACEVAKRITINMVKAGFGINDSSNVGSAFYTSMQAVPAFLPCILKNKKIPCLIPHAVDQDPHFRISRDIIPKLGYDKPASIQSVFLPPLSGVSGKMSSSTESSIFMTDSPLEVKKKINKYAFSGGKDTIEEHRKLGGNPNVDISFQYLKFLFESNDEKLEQIEKDYLSGKILSGEMKAILIEKINVFLKEHQKKREEAKKKVKDFMLKV